MDVYCLRCAEPWDLHYLGHEALWDHPGEFAPAFLVEAHEVILLKDDDAYREGRSPEINVYESGGREFQIMVMSGLGCPACWDAPVPAESPNRDELMAANLASGWDGDPMELLK